MNIIHCYKTGNFDTGHIRTDIGYGNQYNHSDRTGLKNKKYCIISEYKNKNWITNIFKTNDLKTPIYEEKEDSYQNPNKSRMITLRSCLDERIIMIPQVIKTHNIYVAIANNLIKQELNK